MVNILLSAYVCLCSLNIVLVIICLHYSEKCRLWGKLQILGLGTAIKVLLTPEDQISDDKAASLLNRQEVVALINALHQITKSVEFTSKN